LFVDKFLAVGALFFALRLNKPTRFEGEQIMFTIPPNTILLICAAIVGAIIGFLVYGSIKGFKNIFPGA
jgi:UDP-N-acetylmuramyl pentapeptide phosphotransferase/UDP-N-acetylglucosamine-1-phosphate transferase